MKQEYKKMIPNILTATRLFLTPIMILLSFLGHLKIVIILAVIAAFTDLIDGKLARYWNVTSLKGAKLDAIADKVFAIGLIACLLPKNKALISLFILEVIIALTNLYYHYKTNKTESLMIGKIKTVFLFTTIIFSFITILTNKIGFITNGFKFATLNLQVLSLISYLLSFIETINKKSITVEDNISHQKIMEIENTVPIDNLIELTKKYGMYDEKDD